MVGMLGCRPTAKTSYMGCDHEHHDDRGYEQNRHGANILNRASSSSAQTARSSGSKMERANRCSSSARTHGASLGPSYAGDRGERAFPRYCISRYLASLVKR